VTQSIKPVTPSETINAFSNTEVVDFCVITTCSDVVRYQPFGEPCCLHLQGGVTSRFSGKLVSYHITTWSRNPLLDYDLNFPNDADSEDEGVMVVRNFCILHHYTLS